jgi:hypothetical protein
MIPEKFWKYDQNKAKDRQKKSILKNKDGSILLIAMVILLLLTILGIAAINTTTIELALSGNEKTSKIVFYAADTGIEVGRAVLGEINLVDNTNWNTLLVNDFDNDTANDNVLVGYETLDAEFDGLSTLDRIIGDRAGGLDAAGPATFSLRVLDNDDLDDDYKNDVDGIVLLISTGTWKGGETVIRTYVRDSAGDEYAQEHYDGSSSSVAK